MIIEVHRKLCGLDFSTSAPESALNLILTCLCSEEAFLASYSTIIRNQGRSDRRGAAQAISKNRRCGRLIIAQIVRSAPRLSYLL